MEDWENYDNGPSVQRDPETGQFTAATLSSERAREIGKLGGGKAIKQKAETAKTLADDMMEIVRDKVKPEKLKAVEGVVRELARIAATNNSSAAVQAVNNMLVMIGEASKNVSPPAAGEKCALCGHREGDQIVNVAITQELVDRYTRGMVDDYTDN